MPRSEYYGIIGNGETCALISPLGSISWLCLPGFDGTVVFSRALDPRNGTSLAMSFTENGNELMVKTAKQEYIDRTNVLVTTLSLEGLDVILTDFMPWGKRFIHRSVKLINMSDTHRKITLNILSGVGIVDDPAHKTVSESMLLAQEKDFSLGVAFPDANTEIELRKEGAEQFRYAVVYGEKKEEVMKAIRRVQITNVEMELNDTLRFWRDWFDRGRKLTIPDTDLENAFSRNLLVLKLLTDNRTGAILAAPTASFPATPGGVDNWDYRFMWIRDAYFVCRAFLLAGHYTEVKKQILHFYRLQGRDGHWKHPFYTLAGKEPPDEVIVEEYTGPGEEDQIRINNGAKNQLQLDSEGSVLHITYLYYLFTQDFTFLEDYWEKIRKAAGWISRNYNRKEHGIWELREDTAHWTYGKVMCYAGLESAIKIANILGKRAPQDWISAEKRMKTEILQKAWSQQRQAFLQTYSNDSPVDISVLAIEDYGLARPTDSRIAKTVRLMEQKLTIDGGVKRFEDAVLPFYLPTLWLAGHYAKAGNRKRAHELLKNCVNATTSLYLPAEHFDPKGGKQYGNFPQAFCASAFVEQIIAYSQRRELTLDFLQILNENVKTLLDIVGKLKYDKATILNQGRRK